MAKALLFDPQKSKANIAFVELANKLGMLEQRSPTDAIRLVAIEAGVAKLKYPELYREFNAKINLLNQKSLPTQPANAG